MGKVCTFERDQGLRCLGVNVQRGVGEVFALGNEG